MQQGCIDRDEIAAELRDLLSPLPSFRAAHRRSVVIQLIEALDNVSATQRKPGYGGTRISERTFAALMPAS
jgi:hypothetical protein